MSMTLHDFTWTRRSVLPLAAGVVTGSWAVIATVVAVIAHLLGGEAVAASAGTLAGALFGLVACLLAFAAILGCVLDRPVRVQVHPARSALPVSRPIL